jgi:hypothetical protein
MDRLLNPFSSAPRPVWIRRPQVHADAAQIRQCSHALFGPALSPHEQHVAIGVDTQQETDDGHKHEPVRPLSAETALTRVMGSEWRPDSKDRV